MRERTEHSASLAGDSSVDWGSRADWIGKLLREYRARLAEFRDRYKSLLENEELCGGLRLRGGDERARSTRIEVVMSREEYIERRMADLKGVDGDPVAED